MILRRIVLAWAGLVIFWGAIHPSAWADETAASVSSPVVAVLDQEGVQRVRMVLDSYAYEPAHVVVQAGKPVELVLTSVTLLTPHNFVLKEGGLSIDQNVGAGQTLTVRFTPMQPGVWTFYCDKQLLFFKSHREKGMEGRLEVRP